MVSNSKFASAYFTVLMLIFYLLSYIPDAAMPTWMQVVVGGAFGLIGRGVLLSRLNAQDERKTVDQ